MDKAIDIAYKLNDRSKFVEIFRITVSKLIGKDLQHSLYLDSLDKMVINYAESSKNRKAVETLEHDAEALKIDPYYKPPAAFSLINGNDIWFREFLSNANEKEITAAIIHESAHLAGAPDNPLAEFVLDRIHNAAGYRRFNR